MMPIFNIPKLAKGGIIEPCLFGSIGEETAILPRRKSVVKPLDKHYAIYKRTKKARIKKKHAKKSWILPIIKELEKAESITINIKRDG